MQDQFCNAYGKEFCQTKGVCNWIKHQLTIENMIGSQSNKWIFFLKLRRLMGHQVTTHYHQRSLPPQTLPNNQLEMEPTAFFHGTSDIGSSHPASLIACANWFCQSEVRSGVVLSPVAQLTLLLLWFSQPIKPKKTRLSLIIKHGSTYV